MKSTARRMASLFVISVVAVLAQHLFPFPVVNHLVQAAAETSDTQHQQQQHQQQQRPTITETFIEPEVHRYTNVLPKHVCQQIIDMGEANGFPMEYDSIDEGESVNNSSQAIEVLDEDGTVDSPDIFELLRPYIPTIAELIRDQRNEVLDRILFPNEPAHRMPEIGWIFFRKYSPTTDRNSLTPHTDDNMFTVNIALNDDYTGGGVFVIKPTLEDNPTYHLDQEQHLFMGPEKDGVPEVKDHQMTYQWTNQQRTNSSYVMFPVVTTGGAIIHNYTVWHAVAPIEEGIRYSLVLFFDMHNPFVKGEFSDDDDRNRYEDDDYDDDDNDYDNKQEMVAFFQHAFRDCDPTTGRLELLQDSIDVLWVDYDGKPDDRASFTLRPGESDHIYTFPGHEFRAVRSRTDDDDDNDNDNDRTVLASIHIQNGIQQYKFMNPDTKQDHCKLATATTTTTTTTTAGSPGNEEL